MAEALVLKAGLDPGMIEELSAGISDRALPAVLLRLAEAPDGSPRWGLCYLVRCRANGFMLLLPDSEEIRQAMQQMVEAPVEFFFHAGVINVLSARGKAVGETAVELADLPWTAAGYFIKQGALRGAILRQSAILGLEFGNERVRPQPASVQMLADEWIVHAMDDEAAQEYATAAEEDMHADGEEDAKPVDPSGSAAAQPESPEELRKRIKELEAQVLAANKAKAVPGAAAVEMYGKTPGLFQPQRAIDVSPNDLQHLQALAGQPPPRVGQHEHRRQLAPLADAPLQDALMAEMDKQVIEPELGSYALGQPMQDPQTLSKLLVTQVQQNSLLLQKMLQHQKPTDPILGALSGSDSASGSSSTGVKGCVAREAFCRTAKDLEAVSTVVRRNALAELGMDIAREDESIMRRYIERRIPLADHRLLCHVATLAAEGWAVAFQSKNQQMLGFLSILLMFVEQVALDQGKLQLGWLLTGLAEPNHQVHFGHSKRPGLKPFSRLASPLWVSANLAYLRDLDYLESRMDQVGGKKKSAAAALDDDGDKKPAPKKKNGKGKGKGGDSEETAKDATK